MKTYQKRQFIGHKGESSLLKKRFLFTKEEAQAMIGLF